MNMKPFCRNAFSGKTIVSLFRVASVFALVPIGAPGQNPTPTSGAPPQAPPTAPPIEVAAPQVEHFQPTPQPEGTTPYSIGEPTDEEVAYARKVVAMDKDAVATGRGSFEIDGKMIDVPVVVRAQRLLARCEKIVEREKRIASIRA